MNQQTEQKSRPGSQTVIPLSNLPQTQTETLGSPSTTLKAPTDVHQPLSIPLTPVKAESTTGTQSPTLVTSLELFHTVQVGSLPINANPVPVVMMTPPGVSNPTTATTIQQPQQGPSVKNLTPANVYQHVDQMGTGPSSTSAVVGNPLALASNRDDSPTPPPVSESAPAAVITRVRVTSTRRISLVERLNWDPQAKEFWRLNFGIGVNAVPWSRFSSALTEHMLVLPADLATLQQILDNNGAGYVSASTFSEFLNSHGPLSTAIGRTHTYRQAPWFMWYLSHDDCITMLKHCEPGTYVVRFSQSSPGQFALTVKQSAGAFMKCLIYAQHGKYKSRPDEQVTYNDLLELIHASSDSLRPYSEAWHHQPWFKGAMSSEDSVELLTTMAIGDYFVRLSTRASHYVFALVVAPGSVVQEAFARDESGFIIFTPQGEVRIPCGNIMDFIANRKVAHTMASTPSLPKSPRP